MARAYYMLPMLLAVVWANNTTLDISSSNTSQYPKRVQGYEKLLYQYLLDDYEKGARPVIDPNKSVTVSMAVKLNQLLDLNERIQVLTSIVAIDQEWRDEYLTWNPEEFGGIRRVYLPCNRIWLPDVVLYNSVEDINEDPYMQSRVDVSYQGDVVWFPLAKIQTSCKLDIRFYPFDQQDCFLKLGSWSYSMNEVDILDGGFTGIEKPDFVDNGEFELQEFTVERVENKYDCCPDPIITLNVNIKFRRRPMFSMFTIAIPCIMLSLMTIIAFILPPQNEAKIEVQLSVMLSLAVFMLMIGESLPPTSDKVPLIGVHIVIQMGLTALSLMCSVFVLRLVHTDYKDVPEVLRKSLKVHGRGVRLAQLLCVGVPDYLKDHHHVKGKLAILEKHQIELRQTYLTSTMSNGLSGAPPSLRMGLAELCEETAKLAVSNQENETPMSADSPLRSQEYKRRPELKPPSVIEPIIPYELHQLNIAVSKILEHLEDGVLKEQRQAEWRLLGALIDRLLLITLTIAVTLTTAYIYIIAPVVTKNIR